MLQRVNYELYRVELSLFSLSRDVHRVRFVRPYDGDGLWVCFGVFSSTARPVLGCEAYDMFYLNQVLQQSRGR